MPGRWYSWRSGPALVVVLDSTRPDDPEQLDWLERTLASTDATWRIVALHHPPYSSGWHGSATDVREAFQPIFERYGVQLVLAGHDHDYQRSVPINGITYVCLADTLCDIHVRYGNDPAPPVYWLRTDDPAGPVRAATSGPSALEAEARPTARAS